MDSNISNMVLIKYWPTHRVIYSVFSQNGIFILSPQKGLIREVMISHLHIVIGVSQSRYQANYVFHCRHILNKYERDRNRLMSKRACKIKVYSEIVDMKGTETPMHCILSICASSVEYAASSYMCRE